MKHIITKIGILLMIPFLSLAQYNFETFTFSAEINDQFIVDAEMGSVLDDNLNTHVAWFEKPGDGTQTLKYGFYNNREFTVTDVVTYNQSENTLLGPAITVDENFRPHITYFFRKDSDILFSNGNFAVMYAGDPDGDGTFEVNQVSDNPSDKTADEDGDFMAYVQDRPKILLGNDNVITVYFRADGSGPGDGLLVVAKYVNSQWNKILVDDRDLGFSGNTRSSESYKGPSFEGNFPIVASYDYDDTREEYFLNYGIQSGGSWSFYRYYPSFGMDEIEIYTDVNGANHIVGITNTRSETPKYFDVLLDGSEVVSVEEYLITEYSTDNNYGYAIDKFSTKAYFYSQEDLSNHGYFLTKDENGEIVEVFLENVGELMGNKLMHAAKGFVSIVSGSDSRDELYITTGQVGTAAGLSAEFSQNETEILITEEVQFTDRSTGSPTSWNWTFEGGTPASSSQQNPLVVYNEQGTYSVTLTVSTEDSTKSITKEGLIFVKDNTLRADFTADTTLIYEGKVVTFADQSSGEPVNYQWEFEGGTPSASTERNPVVLYNEAGEYDVKLTVQSFEGTADTVKTGFVKVYGPNDCSSVITFTEEDSSFDDGSGPFNYQDDQNCTWLIAVSSVESLGLKLNIEEILENDTLYIYDGGNESYPLIGEYTNLQSFSTSIKSSDNVVYIKFNTSNIGNAAGWSLGYQEGLEADFSSDVVEIEKGGEVTFENLSSGEFTDILWQFENGTPSSSEEANPTVSFEDFAGAFGVKLTISNADFEADITKEDYITVIEILSNVEEKLTQMYPNPTSRFLYVKGVEFKSIQISDLEGQQLIESTKEMIDLKDLADGFYNVIIHAESGHVYSRKILKSN